MKRLVVLISNTGKGSNFKALAEASRTKQFNAKITTVVCDTKNAEGLKYARKYRIPVRIIPKKENLLPTLKKLRPDLITLAGWKQIILDEVIEFYEGRILNLHPGLVPDSMSSTVLAPDGSKTLWNKGLLTDKAIKNFLDKKSIYAGSSIHFLTKEFDFGPVIKRTFEKIKNDDTVESLYKRLKTKEHKIYIEAIKKLTNENQDFKVMIVDGGGRAHALAKTYLKSKNVCQVLCIPGNDLMTLDGVKIFPQINVTDTKQIISVAKSEKVDLVDVAQDDAIAAGLVDSLQKAKIKVFGPTKRASQIEWDKSFARKFMQTFKLPIPKYKVFTNEKSAIKFLSSQKDSEWYVKASGLAAGKGAIYAKNNKAAVSAIRSMKAFGKSGGTFLLEEKLTGEEFSAFAVVSEKKFSMLGYAQDHKTVFNGDKGPNTGGMGCTSTPVAITKGIERQSEEIVKTTIEGLAKLKRPYLGILYLGGIIANGKVKIIEFNARWGEPEAQVILPSIKNDYFSLVSQALEGRTVEIRNDKLYRVVITAAAKGYPGDSSKVIGKEIKNFAKLLKNKNITVYGTRVNISRNKFTAGGSRLFYVGAEGHNVDQARKVAYNALSKVSIDHGLLHYRKDIGNRDLNRLRR